MSTNAKLRSGLIERIVRNVPVLKSSPVLAALATIDRGIFVPKGSYGDPYDTKVVPLDGYNLSEPGLVGYMVHVLDVRPTDRILDVGSGSGYHAAVLSRLCDTVYGVEILPHALKRARAALAACKCDNVELALRDGWDGWPEHAPYDAINVACAAEFVPTKLVEQLRVGGRMVIPVESCALPNNDDLGQNLVLVTRLGGRAGDEVPYSITELEPVHFMQMKHALH
jgi:protein-L-isoaspartate(D-aspartate) O-methyltransferase